VWLLLHAVEGVVPQPLLICACDVRQCAEPQRRSQ
jgi:hypothetical protein